VQDQSLEDCLYKLAVALERGTLSFDLYIKTIRKLAREQFMCRALAKKIISNSTLITKKT
tara:strand:- start:90 stop:269 length:180 start_codon:yes stop_codon:yes gene_type:complete